MLLATSMGSIVHACSAGGVRTFSSVKVYMDTLAAASRRHRKCQIKGGGRGDSAGYPRP